MTPFPWSRPTPRGPQPTTPSSPRPASTPPRTKPKPPPKQPPKTPRTSIGQLAIAAQALVIVLGLVLIGAALAAPAAPAPEPQQWRPATDQERREYDRQRLSEAIDEARRQESGITAADRSPHSPQVASPHGGRG